TPTLGSITHQSSTNQVKCFDDPEHPGNWEWLPIVTDYYAYRDPSGTYHNFPQQTFNSCTQATTGAFPQFAIDGSGYKITGLSTVISPSGVTVNPSSGMTDGNGNQVSAIVVDSSETDWKDTLGRIALKVIKSSNGIDYKYQDVNGDYQTVH